MNRPITNHGEAGRPPYIKPKPVYDDGTAIGFKTDTSLNTKWVLPFIFGVMIGFWIYSVMF